MRKVLLVLLGVFLVTGMLFAAGQSDKMTAAGEKVFTMKYLASNTQMGIKAESLDLFLDEIEKNSNGRIVVERYINGELVQNAEDLLSMLTSGAAEAGFEADMSLSWVAPEWISYTSVPFAFDSREHMIKFFTSEIGDEINRRLAEEHGFQFLDSSVGGRGGRMLTAKKPIRNPADLKGVKFRVPNVIGTVASWEAMGAKVIGVPWSELFTSLQNGLVDAQENPYAEIESGGFYQVQKYIMETAHQFGPQFHFVNSNWFNSLPEDLQKVLLDANKKSFDYYNENTDADDERIKEKVIAAGCVIVPRDEIDIDAFRKIIEEEVLDQFQDSWAPDGWEYIQSLK